MLSETEKRALILMHPPLVQMPDGRLGTLDVLSGTVIPPRPSPTLGWDQAPAIDTADLLPCPFCGSADLYVDNEHDTLERLCWTSVVCMDCVTLGPTTVGDTMLLAQTLAVEAWQQRSGPGRV